MAAGMCGAVIILPGTRVHGARGRSSIVGPYSFPKGYLQCFYGLTNARQIAEMCSWRIA
jgi:hypothetical protein